MSVGHSSKVYKRTKVRTKTTPLSSGVGFLCLASSALGSAMKRINNLSATVISAEATGIVRLFWLAAFLAAHNRGLVSVGESARAWSVRISSYGREVTNTIAYPFFSRRVRNFFCIIGSPVNVRSISKKAIFRFW
jgi:hypothetical protein